jgi:hypothetical protein
MTLYFDNSIESITFARDKNMKSYETTRNGKHDS